MAKPQTLRHPPHAETPDGLIRIIYDHNRVTDRSILMATFREQDVVAFARLFVVRDYIAATLPEPLAGAHVLLEVPLFHPESPANFCTLFQKHCTVGETILIGKWAVPVFFP